uniref:C-type lectin domain-containing protein n=1 Tax=Strongyloides papillosus TaxID=174720 RepID=A0A0N5BRL1_STREA
MFMLNIVFFCYFIVDFYIIFIGGVLCPPSWTYFDDNCWFLSKNSLTYKQAERECKEIFHGTLGKIEDYNQQNFIHYMIEKNTLNEGDFTKLRDEKDTHVNKGCFKRVTGKNSEIPFSSKPNSIIIHSEISNLKSCLKECENVRENLNFNCLSILWYPETHDCLLNSEKESGSDRSNFSIVGIPNNIYYYEYTCSDGINFSFFNDKPNDGGGKFVPTNFEKSITEISNVRTCFGKHRHSSLKGFADKVISSISERECLSECWRCSDCLTNSSLCKSVTYYKESGECVMTSASIKSNREKFNDVEELSDFFDRKRECNIEDCENKEILISFILDGSESIGVDVFNRSLSVVSEILEQVNEVSIFWNVILFQFGSEHYIEIDSKQFDKLQDFRNLLSQIGWRREQYSNLVKSLESAMTTIGDEISKKQYDEVLTFIITDGFTNTSAIEEIPRFLLDFPSSHVYSISLTEAFDSNVLSKIVVDEDKLFSHKNYTQLLPTLSEKLCTFKIKDNIELLGEKKQTQFDFNTLSLNTDPESNSIDEIWIGLGRNEYGEMKWSDKTTPNSYVKKILHKLEVEGYDGNCVYLQNNQEFMITYDCDINRKYVCSFKPSLTIEEKFKRDYSMKAEFSSTTPKSAWTLQSEVVTSGGTNVDENTNFEDITMGNNIEPIKNPF